LFVSEEKSIDKEGLAKKRMTLGDRMYRKGEVLRREALSQSNYLNVILFLEDAGLITAMKDEKNEKKEIIYALSENRAEMEVLRRRLFRLL